MQLYEHQKQALEQTKGFNKVAYYLDMGLGKTFVGSEKMVQLGSDTNIIICQKSKINDWMKHFKDHYPKIQIYNLTDKKQLDDFISHDTAWAGYPGATMTVGIINYDLVFRRSELLQLEHFTLMLDESSQIQNDTAKRTKFILKMKPDNVILLSGTPTSGKYENLWSQMHLLGWEISKELYNRQYVNWVKVEQDGFIHFVIDKEEPYKNVDRLKKKMRDHGSVFMKTEECFDLPEQIFIPITVPKTKEYNTFRKKGLVTIEGTELVGDSTLTKRLYSRMLCGHYNKDKLQAFKDLASSTKDRLIVFYNFNAELDALQRIAAELERPISQVNGHVKDLTAYENEEDSITLVQYQAGAMGLNLQKANKVVFFTLTDKSELFEQAKKRVHRIGQNKTCFYYLMMCKDSVEEVILETLNQRKDFTDYLFEQFERDSK
ncbi:MAG TPA: DEAD/DEAH box helicase [Thermodesulfovibrio thiophilus]|nr:DEAD/DEAH box helicase [Thermodesulfovibrio thiophilus]HQD36989.1 DEAD/DEAH box helicase [Thermodesulfovibrio thiophilus]